MSVVPLSERVACARLRMLGHVLRSDNNSPAQLTLHFAVESQSTKMGRVGRHQSNLLRTTIKFDLSSRNIPFVNTDDLYSFRFFCFSLCISISFCLATYQIFKMFIYVLFLI